MKMHLVNKHKQMTQKNKNEMISSIYGKEKVLHISGSYFTCIWVDIL